MHKKHETQLHFVGIGGIGMSGIAEVFLNQGYCVSGSDLTETDITRRLGTLGATISVGHRAENVQHSNVVVISSAVRPTNPEVVEARRLRIPVIPRAEMLGELMRGKLGIAVAGTHGKTTTTSMIATILTHAGLDPTLVIGGKVDSFGGNAKLGQGGCVVAEADESDGSFLHLPATMGVITNIDNDHLDHYGSLSAIEDAFVDFVGKLPFYGVAAACGEDPGVRRCLGRWTKPVVTYGFSEEWDYCAKEVAVKDLGSTFIVFARESAKKNHLVLGQVELNVPGRHNVLNALAAITVSLRLKIPFEVIAEGLKIFSGVRRRFEICWQDISRRIVIIDDYGHHPTEIGATLTAARSCWSGRIIVVFQPHRYTRTLHCHDGFLSAFHDSDILFLTSIYPAGEEPIEGVSSEALVRDIRRVMLPNQKIELISDLETAKSAVMKELSDGDMVICLGAGSITRLPALLTDALGGSASHG
jgi:UDP-N-acetylmuramate--alanine ligase